MDEPKEAQDNTSEVTKETSEKEPVTFTGEQVKEAERKGRSDGLVEVGRLRTENLKLVTASQKLTARVDKMLEEQDERELEQYQDKPELSSVRERQAHRVTKAKLTDVEQELSDEKERVKVAESKESESTQERNAREIAARLNVDQKLLTRLAKLTDGSTEAIEAEAQGLPKLSETKPLLVDSSKTIGGGNIPNTARGKMRQGWDELHK